MEYECKEPPAWLMETAEEGHWHEQRIKNELRATGWFVEGEQDEVTIERPNYLLKGHIDGMIVQDGVWSCYDCNEPMPPWNLLEIKSMGLFEFGRWKKEGFDGFPKYKAQISLYMEALGYDKCLYIVKNRNDGQKDYNCGHNKTGILNFITSPMPVKEVYANVDLAVTNALDNRLAPAEFDPSTWECRRCAYSKLCIPQPQKLSTENQKLLERACEQWRLAKILLEKGEKEKEAAELILSSFIPETNKYMFDELSISQFPNNPREYYDKKVLEATFQPHQLLPALKYTNVNKPYTLRVTDLRKKGSNGA